MWSIFGSPAATSNRQSSTSLNSPYELFGLPVSRSPPTPFDSLRQKAAAKRRKKKKKKLESDDPQSTVHLAAVAAANPTVDETKSAGNRKTKQPLAIVEENSLSSELNAPVAPMCSTEEDDGRKKEEEESAFLFGGSSNDDILGGISPIEALRDIGEVDVDCLNLDLNFGLDEELVDDGFVLDDVDLDAWTADSKPESQAPVENVSLESAPAENAPIENVPVENEVNNCVTVDDIPIDNVLANKAIVQSVETEELPLDKFPDETAPTEKIPIEKLSVENDSSEIASVNNTLVENVRADDSRNDDVIYSSSEETDEDMQFKYLRKLCLERPAYIVVEDCKEANERSSQQTTKHVSEISEKQMKNSGKSNYLNEKNEKGVSEKRKANSRTKSKGASGSKLKKETTSSKRKQDSSFRIDTELSSPSTSHEIPNSRKTNNSYSSFIEAFSLEQNKKLVSIQEYTIKQDLSTKQNTNLGVREKESSGTNQTDQSNTKRNAKSDRKVKTASVVSKRKENPSTKIQDESTSPIIGKLDCQSKKATSSLSIEDKTLQKQMESNSSSKEPITSSEKKSASQQKQTSKSKTIIELGAKGESGSHSKHPDGKNIEEKLRLQRNDESGSKFKKAHNSKRSDNFVKKDESNLKKMSLRTKFESGSTGSMKKQKFGLQKNEESGLRGKGRTTLIGKHASSGPSFQKNKEPTSQNKEGPSLHKKDRLDLQRKKEHPVQRKNEADLKGKEGSSLQRTNESDVQRKQESDLLNNKEPVLQKEKIESNLLKKGESVMQNTEVSLKNKKHSLNMKGEPTLQRKDKFELKKKMKSSLERNDGAALLMTKEPYFQEDSKDEHGSQKPVTERNKDSDGKKLNGSVSLSTLQKKEESRLQNRHASCSEKKKEPSLQRNNSCDSQVRREQGPQKNKEHYVERKVEPAMQSKSEQSSHKKDSSNLQSKENPDTQIETVSRLQRNLQKPNEQGSQINGKIESKKNEKPNSQNNVKPSLNIKEKSDSQKICEKGSKLDEEDRNSKASGIKRKVDSNSEKIKESDCKRRKRSTSLRHEMDNEGREETDSTKSEGLNSKNKEEVDTRNMKFESGKTGELISKREKVIGSKNDEELAHTCKEKLSSKMTTKLCEKKDTLAKNSKIRDESSSIIVEEVNAKRKQEQLRIVLNEEASYKRKQEASDQRAIESPAPKRQKASLPKRSKETNRTECSDLNLDDSLTLTESERLNMNQENHVDKRRKSTTEEGRPKNTKYSSVSRGSTSPVISKSTDKISPVKTKSSPLADFSHISVNSLFRKSFSRLGERRTLFNHPDRDSLKRCEVRIEKIEYEMILPLVMPEFPVSFEYLFNNWDVEVQAKIGEGSFSEVFAVRKLDDEESIESFVFKVVPAGLLGQPSFANLLPEMNMCLAGRDLLDSETNRASTFLCLLGMHLVTGKYTSAMADACKKFQQERPMEAEQPAPDERSPKQHYVVFLTTYNGLELEKALPQLSADMKASLIMQILYGLAAAEAAFDFEHRDLHLSNLVVADTDKDEIEFRVNGQQYFVKSYGKSISLIDYGMSRLKVDETLYTSFSTSILQGTDLQRKTYKAQHKLVDGGYRAARPETNGLWVKFLISKMFARRPISQKVSYAIQLNKLWTELSKRVVCARDCIEIIHRINTKDR